TLSTDYTRLARSARKGRTIVRMGSAGRERLGTSDEFVGSLDSQVPHPTFDDAEAEANNEFVERLEDNGTHTGLVVIATHGRDIEPHTDQQAERVASRLAAKGVSLWRCKEKLLPFGRWIARASGVAFLAAGSWLLILDMA